MKDPSELTNEIVKLSYEEILRKGIPFLQVFPQMFQETNIAETFKIKKTQRNKTITTYALSVKEQEINQFREQLFLHCDVSLSIFKLPTQAQAAFWFMLFNWLECNNYSITIGPEKRNLLAQYYSRSNDPDSRLVQNILRGFTKSGLLVKCKKTDLICKANKPYEITYKVPFIVSQQKLNKNFINLNEEIIELKSELHKRSIQHLKNQNNNVEHKDIDKAVNDVLNNVIGKL